MRQNNTTPICSFIPLERSGKTDSFEVRAGKDAAVILGGIRWNIKYRQYAFYPAPATAWTVRLADEIAAHLRGLNRAWEEQNKG